jgi:hypothetical protein
VFPVCYACRLHLRPSSVYGMTKPLYNSSYFLIIFRFKEGFGAMNSEFIF